MSGESRFAILASNNIRGSVAPATEEIGVIFSILNLPLVSHWVNHKILAFSFSMESTFPFWLNCLPARKGTRNCMAPLILSSYMETSTVELHGDLDHIMTDMPLTTLLITHFWIWLFENTCWLLSLLVN